MIRRSWWRGPIILAANAQWLGRWDAAPRAHPNDGLLELITADPPTGDRLKVRSRLRTGTHVPHPDIRVERTAATQLEFEPPRQAFVDGRPCGSVRRVSLRLEPDALTVIV